MLLKTGIMLFLYAPENVPLCSDYAPIMPHTNPHTKWNPHTNLHTNSAKVDVGNARGLRKLREIAAILAPEAQNIASVDGVMPHKNPNSKWDPHTIYIHFRADVAHAFEHNSTDFQY